MKTEHLKNIKYRTEKQVAIVEFNRPDRLNAVDYRFVKELAFVVEQVKNDSSIKVVVITGTGEGFCTGADLKNIGFDTRNPLAVKNFLQEVHHILLEITEMEKPFISAVNGYAVGAGCNLALSTDLIIASENAQFSQIFVRVGAVPDVAGIYFLPRLIGMARAREMFYTGKVISAREAERMGLISRVVEHGSLMEETLQLAGQLVEGPTAAIGMIKRMLTRGADMDLREVLQMEAYAQAVAFHTEDFQEGASAFAEKHKANFKGK